MTKNKIINQLKGKNVIVNAEWLKVNDLDLLEWITSSNYWGRGFNFTPKRKQAVVKLEFDEGGVRYYATFKEHPQGIKQSLINQPPWGQDSWQDWNIKELKIYYNKINS